MDTTIQEIIYQTIMITAAGVLTFIGTEIKSYIRKKKYILGYEFDNARVERIIDNAVHFAEAKGSEMMVKEVKKMSSNTKLNVAVAYINKVDKDLADRYGDNLPDMIARKVEQRFRK